MQRIEWRIGFRLYALPCDLVVERKKSVKIHRIRPRVLGNDDVSLDTINSGTFIENILGFHDISWNYGLAVWTKGENNLSGILEFFEGMKYLLIIMFRLDKCI